MTPTHKYLGKLKEARRKASDGPFATYGAANQHVRTHGANTEFRLYKIQHQGDAAFIATAANEWATLIEMVEVATEALQETRVGLFLAFEGPCATCDTSPKHCGPHRLLERLEVLIRELEHSADPAPEEKEK